MKFLLRTNFLFFQTIFWISLNWCFHIFWLAYDMVNCAADFYEQEENSWKRVNKIEWGMKRVAKHWWAEIKWCSTEWCDVLLSMMQKYIFIAISGLSKNRVHLCIKNPSRFTITDWFPHIRGLCTRNTDKQVNSILWMLSSQFPLYFFIRSINGIRRKFAG